MRTRGVLWHCDDSEYGQYFQSGWENSKRHWAGDEMEYERKGRGMVSRYGDCSFMWIRVNHRLLFSGSLDPIPLLRFLFTHHPHYNNKHHNGYDLL